MSSRLCKKIHELYFGTERVLKRWVLQIPKWISDEVETGDILIFCIINRIYYNESHTHIPEIEKERNSAIELPKGNKNRSLKNSLWIKRLELPRSFGFHFLVDLIHIGFCIYITISICVRMNLISFFIFDNLPLYFIKKKNQKMKNFNLKLGISFIRRGTIMHSASTSY